MAGEKDKLIKLQQDKEDVETLLGSLKEAFDEGSLSEDHYNELKGKNESKLQELNSEIAKLEQSFEPPAEKKPKTAPKPIPTPEPEPEQENAPSEEEFVEEKPKKGKKEKPPKEEKSKKSKKKDDDEDDEPIIPVSEPGPGEGLDDGAGGPVTIKDLPRNTNVFAPVPMPSGKMSRDAAAVGTTFDTTDIKNILTKLVNEIRPSGIEVLPEVDNLKIQIERLKAFLEVVKEEKEGQTESVHRLMEEMGELRSNGSSIEARLSDISVKIEDVMDIMAALKPERFTKLLSEIDSGVKMNESKVEKLDDVTSILIKKVSLIESILREIGSVEKIVEFSRDITTRMITIDETEKRVKRTSDKIDGIFMELNKRPENFMLYKAKQDTANELIQEMLKNIDELNTKTSGFVTKDDLDKLEDRVDTRLSSMASSITESGQVTQESPELLKYRERRDEINSILQMIEEQFKAGTLSKKEYEKARDVNLKRLEELAIKAAQQNPMLGGRPTPEIPAEPQPQAAPPAMAASIPMPVVPAPAQPAAPAPPAAEPARELSPKEKALFELDESLRKGLISKESYEVTKKLLGG